MNTLPVAEQCSQQYEDKAAQQLATLMQALATRLYWEQHAMRTARPWH